MALSRVLLFFFLISLCQKVLVALESCESDGSVQLDALSNGSKYKLLQVCLFGHWSYICRWPHYFDNGGPNKTVALNQAGCSGGTYFLNQPNKVPVYLAGIRCSGLERKLIECRLSILRNITCDQKVGVTCSNTMLNYLCQNGELQMNTSTNILYICVSGTWRTLCPKLWGAAQASVACRQLNPRKTIFEATATTITSLENVNLFRYYFYCTGEERNLTDCATKAVHSNLCSGNKVAGVICNFNKAVKIPMNVVFTSTNGVSVEANWIQPSSDSVQYYTNHTITCTSTHGVYTATQHVNVFAAVNESMHMHTIITGLTANTSYNCCVSVYSELGRSEDACDSVITDNNTDLMQIIIISTIVPSCSIASDSGTVQAGFSTQVPVRTKPTSDSVMTTCRSTSAMTKPTSVMTDAQCEANSSTLPWVAGIIIGAVLSAVILLTVIVAVYLWRKKAQSQYKMPDSTTERRVSLTQTNQCYSSVQEPQPYEEFQTNELDNQPAAEGVYSYADHTVNTNVYDSVPQSDENPKEDTTMPVVDNTALYSMGKHDNGAYSQHD